MTETHAIDMNGGGGDEYSPYKAISNNNTIPLKYSVNNEHLCVLFY